MTDAFLKKFYWSIVDLQCYVNFSCKVIQLHIYVYSFSYSFPLWFITGYWIQFPVLYSRTLLFTHPIYNSLHLLITNSQSFPPPLTPSPWQPQVCSLELSLFCLVDKFICIIFFLDSTYKWYHMIFVFLCLAYFT